MKTYDQGQNVLSACDIIGNFRQMKHLIMSQPGLILVPCVFLSSPTETEVIVAEVVEWDGTHVAALHIKLSIVRTNSGVKDL